jgi:uncharacterized iron-regulated membrane protein
MSDSTDNETPAVSANGNNETPAGHFYRVVWRWHFYAGLFVIPFMVMLSLTGIIYLFKPQLDRLMYRDLMYVAPQSRETLASEQLAAALRAYPNAKIISFRPSSKPERSAEVNLVTESGRDLTVYVNPYTARALGEMDAMNNFQAIAVRLHGELLIGQVGDWLVELAACWGLVLLVSGLYLWFPRKGSRVWGVWLPRLNRKNGRVFWRDLHAVSGVYGALVIGFMILTGLPWAGFWGTNFARVWDRFPPQKSPDGYTSVLTGSLNKTTDKAVPWAVEQMPMPASQSASRHEHHSATTSPSSSSGVAPNAAINLDPIVALAKEKGVRDGFVVTLPKGPAGVYTISAPTDDPLREATLHVNQYNGNVLADVRWRDYGLVPKATEMGITLHEGKYFGLANQLLMLFAALVVIALAVSGAVMWWRRRPAKTLGAPAMPQNFPLWKGAVAIIVVMGLAFPLVGISLACALALDYLALSRIPRLKTIFG